MSGLVYPGTSLRHVKRRAGHSNLKGAQLDSRSSRTPHSFRDRDCCIGCYSKKIICYGGTNDPVGYVDCHSCIKDKRLCKWETHAENTDAELSALLFEQLAIHDHIETGRQSVTRARNDDDPILDHGGVRSGHDKDTSSNESIDIGPRNELKIGQKVVVHQTSYGWRQSPLTTLSGLPPVSTHNSHQPGDTNVGLGHKEKSPPLKEDLLKSITIATKNLSPTDAWKTNPKNPFSSSWSPLPTSPGATVTKQHSEIYHPNSSSSSYTSSLSHHSRPSGTNTSAGSSTSGLALPSTQIHQCHHERPPLAQERNRKRVPDSTEGEDEEQGGPRKRARVSRDSGKKFMCPYYKRNPSNVKHTSCIHPGFADAHRLKEHLYRRHKLPPRCDRCLSTFDTGELLFQHNRQELQCPLANNPPLTEEGLTRWQVDKLKGMRGIGQSAEEKWYSIYKVIFPQESRDNYPSPYRETSARTMADRFRLCVVEALGTVPEPLELGLNRIAQEMEHETAVATSNISRTTLGRASQSRTIGLRPTVPAHACPLPNSQPSSNPFQSPQTPTYAFGPITAESASATTHRYPPVWSPEFNEPRIQCSESIHSPWESLSTQSNAWAPERTSATDFDFSFNTDTVSSPRRVNTLQSSNSSIANNFWASIPGFPGFP